MNADRVLSAAEAAEVDRRAQVDFGIPGAVLMENAGRGVWRTLEGELGPAPVKIVFVAGNGNNGGDALVAARWCLYERRAEVACITYKRELSGLVGEQWATLERMGQSRVVWKENPEAAIALLDDADWIVDGLLGTGPSGPIRETMLPLVRGMNAADAKIAAVDVPSGFRDGAEPGEETVEADLTIATGNHKTTVFEPGFRPAAGRLALVDPGFPSQTIDDAMPIRRLVDAQSARHPLPVRAEDHKGRRGRVLVVGGNAEGSGAAVLSALGALHAGAGMVRATCAAEARAAVLAAEPGIMVDPLEERTDWEEQLEWADSVVAGPGWVHVTGPDLIALIGACDAAGVPLVLDASALSTLARRQSEVLAVLLEARLPVVLTPHVGEFARLVDRSVADISRRTLASLDGFPHRNALTVVVKSAVTMIRRPDKAVEFVDGMNPELGVAGSGDVLSGMIGAAAARVHAVRNSEEAWTSGIYPDAVRWAVATHSRAGHALGVRLGYFGALELARSLGPFARAQ